jgi:tetratricopeptide (TPR) repeat protein
MRFSLPILAVILLILSAIFSQAGEPDKIAQADALLQSSALNLPKAKQALALYDTMLQNGGNSLTLLPRLARTAFILGGMVPQGQRAGYYEKGLAFSDRLLKEQPRGVAGHYWKAMNMCGLAEVRSCIRVLRLLPKIVTELEQSLALDETYDQAGAHRVLGRIYYEAPGWPLSVGDLRKSLRHLKAAVRLAPNNSTNHLYLAETLIDLEDLNQARQELEKVLQANQNAICLQDLEEDHRKARRLLAELNKAS